jgi:hypothetical protein
MRRGLPCKLERYEIPLESAVHLDSLRQAGEQTPGRFDRLSIVRVLRGIDDRIETRSEVVSPSIEQKGAMLHSLRLHLPDPNRPWLDVLRAKDSNCGLSRAIRLVKQRHRCATQRVLVAEERVSVRRP